MDPSAKSLRPLPAGRRPPRATVDKTMECIELGNRDDDKHSNKRKKQHTPAGELKKCRLEPRTLSFCSSKQRQVDSFDPGDKYQLESPPLRSLTESNPREHTQQTNPGEQPTAIMADAESARALSTYIFETREELKQYGVCLNSNSPYPEELRDFIDYVVKANRPGPHSPAVKNLSDNAPAAQIENRWGAVELLAPHLMFLDAHAQGGEKFNIIDSKAQFDIAYVTNPNNSDFTLEQPEPDKANGYIRREVAQRCKKDVQPPFSEEEEQKLLSDPVNPPINCRVLCSWYTIRFNSFGPKVILQAARDGLAVNEYMYRLYRRADMAPNAVDTCHWSMTCDMKCVKLFVHWRIEDPAGQVQYHMRCVCGSRLEAYDENEDENMQIVDIRKRLRSLLEHAQSDRLKRIKYVLSRISRPPNPWDKPNLPPSKTPFQSSPTGSIQTAQCTQSTPALQRSRPSAAKSTPLDDRGQQTTGRTANHDRQAPPPTDLAQASEEGRRRSARARRKPDTYA